MLSSKEALEGLIDAYISWRAYQTRECIENDYRYKKLLKDLDRLEKLEKVIEILKERGGIHLYINRNNNNKLTLDFDDCISCVLEPKEYKLLKEVLENDK